MGRAGKLALAAIGGGLALTLAAVASLDAPPPGAPAPEIGGAGAQPELAGTLRRCRTVTASDAECAAAWEARRQRFFGTERDER